MNPILRGLAYLVGTILLILVALVFLAGMLAGRASAQTGDHGDGHALNHEWYQGLKQPGTGYSCCNNQDCRPMRAYLGDDGLWRAFVDGKWETVPARVVLNPKFNKDPIHAHGCRSVMGVWYCFLPAGAGT